MFLKYVVVFDSLQNLLELNTFLSSLGLSALADKFLSEAVDLSLMLSWTNPKAELEALGITQQGPLVRLVEGLRAKRKGNLKR